MKKLSAILRGTREKFSTFASDNQFLLLTLVVIFLGALWRFWGLTTFKGFSVDEITLLKSAREIVNQHWTVPTKLIGESLYLYKIAVLGQLTSFSVLYFRLFSALAGIVVSIFFFIFTRSWFNKQVALIATLLMATNTTMLILSRVANTTVVILALQMAILYIATAAFREKNKWLFLLTALLSSAGIFLSPLFILTGILIFIAGLTMIAKNKKVFALYKYELMLLATPILLTSGAFLYLNWGAIGSSVAAFLPGSIAAFYLNVGQNILTLFAGSATVSPVNVALEPILDPFVAVSSICGIVYAFFHSGKRKHQFILLWVLFSVIIISFAKVQQIANVTILLPAIFILSSIMLDYLLTSWVRTFPYNRSARIVMTLLFSVFLFLSVYYNFQKYFYAWQGNPAVQEMYTKTLDLKK